MNSYVKSWTGAVFLVSVAAGCAVSSPLPIGMVADKFVSFSCEGGKQFQARATPDGSSVRIRYEGGYELDQIAKGIYEGAGWKFVAGDSANSELFHNGKSVLKSCKVV